MSPRGQWTRECAAGSGRVGLLGPRGLCGGAEGVDERQIRHLTGTKPVLESYVSKGFLQSEVLGEVSVLEGGSSGRSFSRSFSQSFRPCFAGIFRANKKTLQRKLRP